MQEYIVKINGVPHTLQLSDEDAARYGDAAVAVERVAYAKAAPAPRDKAAAAPANKGK